MQQGYIYKLKKEFKSLYDINSFKHYFIFWEMDSSDIKGIMLTHTTTKQRDNNHKLLESHFKKDFSFKYDQTHFVELLLLKKVKYEHLDKCGELTKSGVEYISKIVYNLEYTDWLSYINTDKH